ncbi:MAG: tRNA (guanosine(37)-N1)-methyltransferase TrmD [Arsenophonus sp.]|nr:MAG: tRNA (guanosine(37)-N1)-methyltransferase TrmD [Arsenophonus sp.]
MNIGIISIFPKLFSSFIKYGIVGKAIKNNFLNVFFWNPRNYTYNDKYRRIDFPPYGGGSGMVMSIQPIRSAVKAAKKKLGNETKVLYLTPQGKTFTYKSVASFIKENKFICICGRYRGVDERVIQTLVDEEWSIGDYILTGGELPAMVLIDAISRFIPGVLNNKKSVNEDSFTDFLFDYPNYTKPFLFSGLMVPNVLLSGNHKLIKRWRLKQSLGKTWLKKPSLLKKKIFNSEEKMLLLEFQKEYNK